jgi:hypothetical protein
LEKRTVTLLEKMSNVAVIVLAAGVLGFNIYDRFVPRVVPPSQMTLVRKYMGKPLPLPAAVPQGQRGTVALFVSKDCHFCSESMAFYRRLATVTSAPPCSVKMVALGPKEREKREDIEAYLAVHNLSVDAIDMVDFPTVNVSGTPTLVVEDGSKLVRGIWVGKLSEIKENEVLDRVKSYCQS